MNQLDPQDFKNHLNKIIGYLDEITGKLNKMLDAYLLVEENKPIKKERKPKKKYKRISRYL